MGYKDFVFGTIIFSVVAGEFTELKENGFVANTHTPHQAHSAFNFHNSMTVGSTMAVSGFTLTSGATFGPNRF